MDQDVTRFDVSMNKVLLVHRSQPGSNLRCNLQRHLHFHPPRASDEMLKGLSLDELHRIKVTAPGSTQMEDRGNIGVTDARRCAGFTQKSQSGRFITEISLADDLQCHWAAQIDVECLVSYPHCTATQFNRFPVFARHQLIMLKSMVCMFRCRLGRFLERRFAGLNSASETLAKQADRTEFHRSRKLVTAARAGAFGLRAHFPNRPSATTAADSNTMPAPIGAKSASIALGVLLSRCTSNRVFP